jgi:hypothetical protein
MNEEAKTEALATLASVASSRDVELAHAVVDDALCDFLMALGYDDVVEIYRRVPKWYA